MAKKSKAIMIVGPIVLSLVAILAVYFVLISTGVITAREYTLRIEAISREKEYDGTPLTLGENDYRIVEGEDILEAHNHHVVVHFEGNQIDAGTCEAKMIVSVFDSTNADVTKRYNIETTNGVITVNPRSVTIRTYGATYAYDGNEHSVQELAKTFEVINSNPVSGHNLSFAATGKITEIGEMPVDVAISIMDDDGNQINPANYRVYYEDTEENPRGKIVVRPRYIYLDSADIQEFYYDGKVHDFNESLMSNVNYERSELETGVSINYIRNMLSATDVNNPHYDEDGNYLYDSYQLDNFDIKVTQYGKDVSAYYQIDPECTYVKNSKMTIKPIELTLTTLSHEKIYDGTILDPSKDEVMKNAYIIQNLIQVPSSENVKVQFDSSITNVYRDEFKNVQGIDNSAKLLITNSNGEDTSKNYNIKYEFGKLTIKPREMTLKTYSQEELFTGDTLYGIDVLNEDGENYKIIVGDVAPNQELFVTMESKISNVGTKANSIDKYFVKDKDGNEVTDNYQITLEEGELKIIPVAISISTASHVWNYDGKDHSDENATVQGLPNACSIEYFNYPKVSNATLDLETGLVYTVDNIPDFIIYDRNKNVVYDSSNEEESQNNFNIAEASWGELSVLPLEMTIYTDSLTKTYDGTKCFNHNYTIEGKRDGDKIELSWPNDFIYVQRDEDDNVISVENKPKISIFDSKNKNITDNYLVRYECGELKVNPVYLSVTTKNVAKLYDGTPIEVLNTDYDISSNVLVGNDHIANIRTINDYVDVIKENGTVVGRDNIVTFDILDENNQDVSSNYAIDLKTVGKLTISPVEITITTKSDSFLFDGESHVFDQGYAVTCGGTDTLPSVIGYTVSGFTSFVFAPTNDNYYTNSCTVSFFNNFDNSKPMTDNIKLIEDFGKIYVGKADVVVRTGSAEKLYDGTKLECNDVYIEGASKEFLDGIGATWTIDESKAMDPFINVERGANGKVKGINNKLVLKFSKVINGNATDITSSINVIYEYGTLTINPIQITIYTQNTKDAIDNTYSKEWDGTDIYDNEIVFTDEDQEKLNALGITNVIAKSDYTKFSDVVRKINGTVDKVANKVTPIFYQGSKEFDANNLEIDNQTGYLKILPIPVEVITKKAAATLDGIVKKTYDGTTLYDNEIAEATQNALAPYGITIEVIDGGEGLTNVLLKNGNVSTVSNTIKYRFMKGVEEVSKDNFEIIDSTGKLRIDPVEITIQTEKSVAAGGSDVTAIFGNVDKLEDYELVIPTGSLSKLNALGLSKSNLVVTYHTKLEEVVRDSKGNAIAVNNDITVVVKDNNGSDITDNFKITYDTGKLKLIALSFTVSSGSKTFQYNGFEQYIVGGGLEIVKGAENLVGYTYNFTNVNPLKVTDVKVDSKNKVTSYDNVVEYKLVIKDSNGKDVTNNFTWDNKWGTLTVEPAVIHVNAPGAKKVFDNEELTNDEISIVNDSFTNILNDLNHQIINLKTTGSQLTAGKSAQTYTYNVIDKGNNDADVTSNYKLVNMAPNSDLEVEPLTIGIYSCSDTKIYDGDPLTCEECEVFPSLPSGFTVNVTYTGSQTEIGIGPNTFTVELIDCDGVSFSGTSKYKNSIVVQKYLGDLEVLPYVTGSGNLLASTPTPDPTINSFSIVVSKPGIIYLRDRSYGDYNGSGWDYISTSNAYINDDYQINPISITSKVLEDNGYSAKSTVTITMNSSLPYLIPYYSTTLYESNSRKITDDSHISISHDDTPYSFEYYTYHYNLADLELTDSNYINFEDDYSLYAKTQYTAIPSALKAKLKQLGEENDIKVKDSNLIVKIADLFRNGSYVYGNFPNRNEASDIVEFFLKNNGGTCQDFATIATLMYRAYGIPARYVTGFAKVIDDADVNRNVDVTQTNAHAWVEIYINGMGWINVEVTSGNDGIISSGGSTGGSLTGSSASGQISKQMEEPDEKEVLFKIYSGKVGNIYLRNTSFGDYNGLGFDDASSIAYTNPNYNPLEYGANALGTKKFNISIDLTKNKYQGYLIPYYCADSLKEFNDVYVDGDYGAIYDYQFTNNSIDYDNYDMVSSQLSSYEMAYRSYVYANYLDCSISLELKEAFDEFISANGIDKNNVDIELVREAIQLSAIYTYDFNIPNSCDDIVLWFLQNKMGVCQHFAATATMLYRYLGIPARYTTGVVAQAKKVNTWTDVTADKAHAWVEVYLDGFGWTPVEVTGGEGGGGGDGVKKATIYPSTKHVLYGNPNYEVDTVYFTPEYANKGYYVVAEITGEDPSLGIHTTKIVDYTIYDKDDNDVTGEFEITLKNGTLQVYAAKITVTTESSIKEYDGTPLINHNIEEVDLSGLLYGHHFNNSAINFKDSSSQTNVGSIANDFTYSNELITDEYGISVIDQYWIVRGTGTLTVTKRNIELTADDGEIFFEDFLELGVDKYIVDTFTITNGTLIDGHEIVDWSMMDDSYLDGDENWFALNEIDLNSIKIVDHNNGDKDVTSLYNFTAIEGYLMMN